MKKIILTLGAFILVGFISNINAQETKKSTTTEPARKPAYQNAENSGGLTDTQKLIRAEENKTVTTKTLEGFNKGMERQEPGSTAAEVGTGINKKLDEYTQKKESDAPTKSNNVNGVKKSASATQQ
ncbi:hypothetical protein BSF41_12640 [Flavobacterium sp. ACN2]|uniref:hypothetical protein n=1 Tax=Flavobacterium sp. ACN2 TaxID=1975676 RepID=UPI000BB36A1F|nr:hypothetical protein [Flavobacterium sp. ACN2]PBI91661.1 hypothetical protein BSF41_12640 [Flavobacterium sp. ACN2]